MKPSKQVRAKETPKTRALEDAVARARPRVPEIAAEHYAELGAFAREHELDPSRLFDELEDRTTAHRYLDVQPAIAAQRACAEVLELHRGLRG